MTIFIIFVIGASIDDGTVINISTLTLLLLLIYFIFLSFIKHATNKPSTYSIIANTSGIFLFLLYMIGGVVMMALNPRLADNIGIAFIPSLVFYTLVLALIKSLKVFEFKNENKTSE